MLQRTLLNLIVVVLSTSCGPRQASPIPTSTVEATATASGGDAGGNAGTEASNPGSYMPPGATEGVANWWGVIRRTPPGAQYDDYFERQDLGTPIYFGIDSMDPGVRSQIETLRDTGKIVHLYGTVLSDVPDYNGSQIKVDRIQVEE